MSTRHYLSFTAYEWLVLFSAWLGWGFDIFDALLFNYVSRLCIPALLGPEGSSPQAITFWTGVGTSILLFGWGVGGIAFGKLTDRIGRTRTLLLTILTYAVATTACAFATSIEILLLFRFIASLGIGGEWAAGAALVAETVKDRYRVAAGAILYTAAPLGLFLATFVTDLFTRQLDFIANDPNLSWRAVFLTGLLPAALALLIRLKVREPESFSPNSNTSLKELFTPELSSKTIGGLGLASLALLTFWSLNAFGPAAMSFIASETGGNPEAISRLKAEYVTKGMTCFNLGGLIGTLLTIPLATRMGRRPMFYIYFSLSALTIYCAFGIPLDPEFRFLAQFFVGLCVFGVFGSFTFYLPELFPARLRGTGSGFCYNAGRFLVCLGPFFVGDLLSTSSSSAEILHLLSLIALLPIAAVIFLAAGYGEETRQELST